MKDENCGAAMSMHCDSFSSVAHAGSMSYIKVKLAEDTVNKIIELDLFKYMCGSEMRQLVIDEVHGSHW